MRSESRKDPSEQTEFAVRLVEQLSNARSHLDQTVDAHIVFRKLLVGRNTRDAVNLVIAYMIEKLSNNRKHLSDHALGTHLRAELVNLGVTDLPERFARKFKVRIGPPYVKKLRLAFGLLQSRTAVSAANPKPTLELPALATTAKRNGPNIDEVEEIEAIRKMVDDSLGAPEPLLSAAGVIGFGPERKTKIVQRFIRTAIAAVVRRRRKSPVLDLEIDAMGIKCATVSEALTKAAKKGYLVGARIRYLQLKKGSAAASHRQELESGGVNASITAANTQFSEFRKSIAKAMDFEQHYLKWPPAYYIVRINSVMLLGFYLNENGRNSPYLLLAKTNGSLFDKFEKYFGGVFQIHAPSQDSKRKKDARPKKSRTVG